MGEKGIDAAIQAYEKGLELCSDKKQKKTQKRGKTSKMTSDIDLLDYGIDDGLSINDIDSLIADTDDFEFLDDASAISLEDL